MSILVAVASRHGSTTDIAEAIAKELRSKGHIVDVRTIEDTPIVEDHEALIIGSAVYMGSWLPHARQFVEHGVLELTKVPLWLFSSGPLGDHEPDASEPLHLDTLMQQTGARGHRTFVGKLDKSQLGLGERFSMWNVSRVKPGAVAEGDHRDWDAIRTWADEIAAALPPAAGPQG